VLFSTQIHTPKRVSGLGALTQQKYLRLNSAQSCTATAHALLSPAQVKSLLLKLLAIEISLPQAAHAPLNLVHDPYPDSGPSLPPPFYKSLLVSAQISVTVCDKPF
jgi:hypothetical protein